MARNKLAEANTAFSGTIQKVLSSLTKSQWKRYAHPEKGDVVKAYILLPLVLKDAAGNSLYKLSARIITEVVSTGDGSVDKRVRTREYIYQVTSYFDNKALYEFHWHPEKIDSNTLEPAKLSSRQNLPFPHPHVHVRAIDLRFDDLKKRHIPSGRVALEDVIRFLISEGRVEPYRVNWSKVLADTKKEFDKNRKW